MLHEKTSASSGYDYSQPGWYAVTICTYDRRKFFGRVANSQVQLSQMGCIAQSAWTNLPEQVPYVRLDAYVFMPNHMHGIIELLETPSPRVSLGKVIRRFKASVTCQIRQSEGKPWFAWQEDYWKSVIFNEKSLLAMRQYIIDNPVTWEMDTLYKYS